MSFRKNIPPGASVVIPSDDGRLSSPAAKRTLKCALPPLASVRFRSEALWTRNCRPSPVHHRHKSHTRRPQSHTRVINCDSSKKVEVQRSRKLSKTERTFDLFSNEFSGAH